MLARSVWFLVPLAALWLAGCPTHTPGFDVGHPDTGLAETNIDASQNDAADSVTPDVEDTGPRCLSTQIVCDGRCVSAQIDPLNCGACGMVCPMNTVCASGGCHEHCPTGLQGCPDPSGSGHEICIDLQNSRLNCGTCGHVCPSGGTCSTGVCILDCGSRTLCNGGGADAGAVDGGTPYCADLTFDPNNCGACGVACPPSHICNAGHCVIDCVYPQTGCPPTGSITDSYCADLGTDRNNCGACGNVCPTGRMCITGTCTLCAPPQTECPPTGTITDPYCATLESDVNNCGACGHACTPPQTCGWPGTCICSWPLLACGTGCIDPRSDPNNCGSCGNVCGAGSYCSASSCVLCAPRTLCPGNLCTDTQTDIRNCGTCGTVCPTGNVCQAGACICPTGSMICSGTCVNLQWDRNNCGSCGNACSGTMSCSGGMCVTDPTFHVTGMSSSGCILSPNEESQAGDDCGGLAIGSSNVFYTGDSRSVVIPAADVSTVTTVIPTETPGRYVGLVSNILSGDVYALLDATGTVQPPASFLSSPVTITQLGLLDPATGRLTTTRVMLSSPITFATSGVGIYSGYGRAIVYTNTTDATRGWYHIELPSGRVTPINTGSTVTGPLSPMTCETFAHWGIAEFFGGEYHVLYMRFGTPAGVARFTPSTLTTDATMVMAAPGNSIGDICMVAFSPSRNRWYFHYEGAPTWAPPPGGTFGEFVGYCAGTWESP